MTYRITTRPTMTVLAIDIHGEAHDLNTNGEPITVPADLCAFVRELHEQGCYGTDVRDELLALGVTR
jgi:hypothetical protein